MSHFLCCAECHEPMIGVLSYSVRVAHDCCGGKSLIGHTPLTAQEREEVFSYHAQISHRYQGKKPRV